MTDVIDKRAVYGSVVLGANIPDECVPHHPSMYSLKTAIRETRPGDRVRVNDKAWMGVFKPDGLSIDEGFACRYENNSDIEYAVRVTNPSDNPSGTFNLPWMRRLDNHRSAGEVYCLEVEWTTDR